MKSSNNGSIKKKTSKTVICKDLLQDWSSEHRQLRVKNHDTTTQLCNISDRLQSVLQRHDKDEIEWDMPNAVFPFVWLSQRWFIC